MVSGINAQKQPNPSPLTKNDVLKLLAGSLLAKRVEQLAAERGITFQQTQAGGKTSYLENMPTACDKDWAKIAAQE